MFRRNRRIRVIFVPMVVLAVLLGVAGYAIGTQTAARASGSQQLDLRVLLIGQPGGDPTTQSWQSALDKEGVAYTLVTGNGTSGSETLNLPNLTDPNDSNHGLYNGVVLTASEYAFAWPQLLPVFQYEAAFGVRQVDGYIYPGSNVGLDPVSGGDISGTTSTLTAAGLSTFPELKGPVPMDTGTYGYGSTVDMSAPGTTTPLLDDSSGNVAMAIYQHPNPDYSTDQSGVSELAITFDYGPTFLQWLILAPGIIDWLTNDAHLGLSRNYFGQNVDDVFLPDNSWSSTYHCTPGATDPPDVTCPPGVANNPADTPPDQQMSAADVDYVVNWEKQTGITLQLAFNGQGACTTTGEAPVAQGCPAGQDPVVDTSEPDDQAFVAELLQNRSDFNWVNHTWSHQFLGCTVFQGQPVSSITDNSGGGSLPSGTESYEVTAATAYGESEPSALQQVTVNSGDSATLTWPDAPNGGGPALWQLEGEFGGGTGFWGYNVYRENSDGSFGLVGTVAEDPSGGTSSYSFTDTGATTPGAGPTSTSGYPTATNPGIDCTNGGWDSISRIENEFENNISFAADNGITNFDPAAVVTGEHSGVENPNMPAAMGSTHITTFRTDASRQPAQYAITGSGANALSAPSYPSNIYYNAANWQDEIDEYNTIYEVGAPNGHCVNTSSTTCITSPATEASILASESRIELGHVLDNDPRVGYAHQMNLIGPATQGGQDYGYTLLTFLDNVLSQYNSWYRVPLAQMTISTEAAVLNEQSAWARALSAGNVTATQSGTTITVTNNGGQSVEVPVSAPIGSSINNQSLGQQYGGTNSGWESLAAGASLTINASGSPPVITSNPSTTATTGSAFSYQITTSGTPTPSLSESGALPQGVTFTDNGDGTATLGGTPAAGTGGTYPITLTATSEGGTPDQQAFTLVVDQAPAITSTNSATVQVNSPLAFTVQSSGTPTPALSESGSLPNGVTFTDNQNGTAALSGTPTTSGTFPLTITASNNVGSAAQQSFTLTVTTGPAITSANSDTVPSGTNFSFQVTTTGTPNPALSESGALPAGVTFTDNGNGTATIAGSTTSMGSDTITITANNGVGSPAQQSFTLTVGTAPSITSTNATTFGYGKASSFTVTVSSNPTSSISLYYGSQLPAGVSFHDNGNNTATMSGTPTQSGMFSRIAIVANNGINPEAVQFFTVTVNRAPAFTSSSTANFTVKQSGAFTVQTNGYPAASITKKGTVPGGLTFTSNSNGTATLSGSANKAGTSTLTLTATNSSGKATQTLTVQVITPAVPTVKVKASTSVTVGSLLSLPITTTGTPTPAISETGSLPTGVTLVDNGNGTGQISGTPAPGTEGTYNVTVYAKNSAGQASAPVTIKVKS